MDSMVCSDCNKVIEKPDSCGTGYGITGDGKKVCYDCCAVRDCEDMRKTGRATLYVVQSPQTAVPNWPVVTNWPGTLRFPAVRRRISRNNWGAQRMDVWFTDSEGKHWWGVNCGDNQILRCRRLKAS